MNASSPDLSTAIRDGIAALDSDRDIDAAAALKRSLSRTPKSAAGWQVLGLLHRSADRLADAVAAFDRALALAPDDARIRLGRATVLLEAGLPAVGAFEDALAVAGLPEDALRGLVAALVASGERKQALARIDAQLEQSPGWLAGHDLAAQLRWAGGDTDTYLSSLDRALARYPGDMRLWQARFDIDARAGRFEGVAASVVRSRSAIGQHRFIDVSEAIACSELGDAPRAERVLAPIEQGTDIGQTIQRARHDLRVGRPERVAARLEPMLKGQDACYAWPYLLLAWRILDDPSAAWLDDPSLIGVYDLASDPELADCLRAIHVAGNHPLDQSLRGGTQTDGPLLRRIDPAITRLREQLRAAVAHHLTKLPPPDPQHPLLRHRRDARVRFAGSWSVRLTDAGHHIPHVHPGGWLSSAFYAALPASNGEDGWLELGRPEAGLCTGLSAIRTIEPKVGRLVLFPSFLWHGTVPFARGERLTVAFDVASPR